MAMKGHQKRNVREDGIGGLRSVQMREVRRGLESKHPLKQVQMKTWDCLCRDCLRFGWAKESIFP